MGTLVHAYAVNPMGSAEARRKITDHPELIQQLFLAHRLRNSLVEIEHDHDTRMAEMWSRHPAVAEAEADMTAALATLTTLTTQANAERSQDRRSATRPATAKEITSAKKALTSAKKARKAAIVEAYPATKPAIENIRAIRKAAIKALYADYVQTQGIYWATYNLVVRQHETAVKLIQTKRKNGQPAELRFHRWDGTGTIAVQLQRGATDPVRSPTLLASGKGPWRNVFQLRPCIPPSDWARLTRGQQTAAGRGEAIWTLGRDSQITLPVQVHRPLPPEADIAMVTLTRTVTAGRARLSLNVTIRVPDPTPAQGQQFAIHMGWRSRPDGSVRVATWATDKPVTVPVYLRDYIVIHDTGRTGEIIYPAKEINHAAHPASITSTRDTAREPVQAALAAWLDQNPQPDPRDPDKTLTGARVRQWRSPGAIVSLIKRWNESPPEGAGKLLTQLEAWRRQDAHLWQWEAHERAQINVGRNDAWAKVAAWLTTDTGVVVLDDTDLAAVRQKADIADTDPVIPGEAAQAARARAAITAPGLLRSKISTTATRRGVTITEVSSTNLSRTHHSCGYTAPADPRYAAAAVVTCPSCGNSYDQDHNAVMLMLDRARDLQLIDA